MWKTVVSRWVTMRGCTVLLPHEGKTWCENKNTRFLSEPANRFENNIKTLNQERPPCVKGNPKLPQTDAAVSEQRPPSTETTRSAVSEAEVAVVFLLFNFTPPRRVYLLTQQQSARRTCGSFGSHFAEEVPTVGGRLVVLGASRSIVRRSRNWRRRRLFWHRISGNDIIGRMIINVQTRLATGKLTSVLTSMRTYDVTKD